MKTPAARTRQPRPKRQPAWERYSVAEPGDVPSLKAGVKPEQRIASLGQLHGYILACFNAEADGDLAVPTPFRSSFIATAHSYEYELAQWGVNAEELPQGSVKSNKIEKRKS